MNAALARKLALLEQAGARVAKDAHILDYGCGAGRTVYALRDAGYANTVGYDLKDYLELRDPADHRFFRIAEPGSSRLPFASDSVDVLFSEQVLEHVQDQVLWLKEMQRVLRPGGVAIHEFPARYCPVEPHIHVPFGGVFAHRWWYKLWARAGIRNAFQAGLSADETADRNAFYFVEGLRYVPNSCYRVVWARLGFDYRFLEQEQFDTSAKRLTRWIGKLNRIIPVFGWLYRTFHMRLVMLRKTSS